jgi:hypothetical protein
MVRIPHRDGGHGARSPLCPPGRPGERVPRPASGGVARPRAAAVLANPVFLGLVGGLLAAGLAFAGRGAHGLAAGRRVGRCGRRRAPWRGGGSGVSPATCLAPPRSSSGTVGLLIGRAMVRHRAGGVACRHRARDAYSTGPLANRPHGCTR